MQALPLWLAGRACYWPDVARSYDKFNRPTWHYQLGASIVAGDRSELSVPEFPGPLPSGAALETQELHIEQALDLCRKVMFSDASDSDKAIALCWIGHLVGDSHQPCHAGSLYGEAFPEGDRGANSIETKQARNMHALWDQLLGRGFDYGDVKRRVVEISTDQELQRNRLAIMPFYQAIDGTTQVGKRTIDGCLRLRDALESEISNKTLDSTLLLASWNIREFGGTKSNGRELESLVYIAEIMSRFDLIAVQEVRSDLDHLDQLMRIPGGWWKYLVSDVTIGRSGNNERTAFIYDSRKLSFGGLAGELVPEAKKVNGLLESDEAFSRSPFLAGFRAGWFKFTICSMHMYYGTDSADVPQRAKDAEFAAKLLKLRMKQKDRWAYNAILQLAW